MLTLTCLLSVVLLLLGFCWLAGDHPHDAIPPLPAREIVTVRGSHYQMGLEHGKAFRDEILFNIDRMHIWGGVSGNETACHALLQRQYDAVADYAPDVFEEIEGIAAGAGVEPETIKLMTFRAWNHFPSLCTAVGMKDSSGKVYIGGNIDDPAECYVLMRHEPSDAYNYVDMRWAGAAWGCNGINEKGFGYTLAGLWDTEHFEDPLPAVHIPTGIVHRTLLSKCATVAEAIEVLSEARVRWNTVLGDAKGNLAMAQCMGSVMGIEYPDDPGNNGLVGSSNHAFRRELIDAMAKQGKTPGAQPGSLDRRRVIEGLRADPNVGWTLNDLQNVLRNHDNYRPGEGYPSICNDTQAYSNCMEITADEPEFYQAMAPACRHPYVGYKVKSRASLVE